MLRPTRLQITTVGLMISHGSGVIFATSLAILETCWKIHGKPVNWKSSKQGEKNRGFPTANEADSGPFNKDQIDQLLKLIKSNSSSGTPSVFLAQTGRNPKAFSCLNFSPWIIDSGASDHMTSFSHLFSTYFPCSGHDKIRIADGSFSPIAGKGFIKLTEKINLNSVLHVPNLACNLLSVSKLSKDSNCRVTFFESHCEFQDQNSGKMIGRARMLEGLYYFDEVLFSNKKAQSFNSTSSISIREKIMLWHYRLGHPSFLYLKHLFPELFKGIDCSSFHCESCIFAKFHRYTYLPKHYQASKPFYLIHSDVWGPSKITTLSGKRWFVTFINDHTRLCWIYLMNKKSDVKTLFTNFYNMIETNFYLHSDNGTEYFNEQLGEFLAKKGIFHQSTCRDTTQQNGIAERKNKHLLEVARAIMFYMHVPKYLWGEAILTASYLINRMPTKVLTYKTPFDCLKTFFPDTRLFSDLPAKVFGCTAYVHVPSQFRSKLDPRAIKCVFLGYSSNQKGYKCFDPQTKKFHVSMDVSFVETKSYFPNNSLQGETSGVEDNFWDISIPLPNVIYPTQKPHLSDNDHLGEPSSLVPSQEDSCLGGEVLQNDLNSELQVYTRKRLSEE
ncbi:unnamed protein product [Camellia sinensis]